MKASKKRQQKSLLSFFGQPSAGAKGAKEASRKRPRTKSICGSSFQPCPLCGQSFSRLFLQAHAASCKGATTDKAPGVGLEENPEQRVNEDKSKDDVEEILLDEENSVQNVEIIVDEDEDEGKNNANAIGKPTASPKRPKKKNTIRRPTSIQPTLRGLFRKTNKSTCSPETEVIIKGTVTPEKETELICLDDEIPVVPEVEVEIDAKEEPQEVVDIEEGDESAINAPEDHDDDVVIVEETTPISEKHLVVSPEASSKEEEAEDDDDEILVVDGPVANHCDPLLEADEREEKNETTEAQPTEETKSPLRQQRSKVFKPTGIQVTINRFFSPGNKSGSGAAPQNRNGPTSAAREPKKTKAPIATERKPVGIRLNTLGRLRNVAFDTRTHCSARTPFLTGVTLRPPKTTSTENATEEAGATTVPEVEVEPAPKEEDVNPIKKSKRNSKSLASYIGQVHKPSEEEVTIKKGQPYSKDYHAKVNKAKVPVGRAPPAYSESRAPPAYSESSTAAPAYAKRSESATDWRKNEEEEWIPTAPREIDDLDPGI